VCRRNDEDGGDEGEAPNLAKSRLQGTTGQLNDGESGKEPRQGPDGMQGVRTRKKQSRRARQGRRWRLLTRNESDSRSDFRAVDPGR
jgi:hypothetical protein